MPTFLIILLFIGIFYFITIRPKKKQEQQANALRNNLRVGDEITTIDGIIGEIIHIKEDTVVIETSRAKTRLRVLRDSIATVDVHAEDK